MVAFQQNEPNNTKPPVSPYITFCSAKRAEVRQQYPNATFGDVGRLLGSMWGSLTPEEKHVYVLMANEKNQQTLTFLTQQQQQQQMAQSQYQQLSSSTIPARPLDNSNDNNNTNSAGGDDDYQTHMDVHDSSSSSSGQPSAIPVQGLLHPSSMIMPIPDAKTKAPSAYVNFCRAYRADVKEKYPGASIAEQGRILGQMWSSTDELTRKVSCLFFNWIHSCPKVSLIE